MARKLLTSVDAAAALLIWLGSLVSWRGWSCGKNTFGCFPLPSRAGTAPTRGAASSACILSVDEAMAAAIARRRRMCHVRRRRVGYGESPGALVLHGARCGHPKDPTRLRRPGDGGAQHSAVGMFWGKERLRRSVRQLATGQIRIGWESPGPNPCCLVYY